MKYASSRPYVDPEAAARKLLEITNATEVVQDGRIHIEKINGPFLFKEAIRPSIRPVSNSPSCAVGCGGMSLGHS